MNVLSNTTFVKHLTDSVQHVLPEATLVGAACALFLLAAFGVQRSANFVVAILGIAGAVYVMFVFPGPQVTPENRHLTSIDPNGLAEFVRWIALAAALVYTLLAWSETESGLSAEYLACVLVVAAGLSLVGRANDLITMFLALEMMSIPTYVLLYLPSKTQAGQEAALKYFMLSVLSAGVMLFGFSYFYGVAGTSNITAIVHTISASVAAGSVPPLAVLATLFIMAGLGFRLTAVPFHFYAPDVYEGGPNGVVAQLAFIPKVAGFVALVRLLGLVQTPLLETALGGKMQLVPQLPFDTSNTLVPLTLWVIAAITMSFGNLLALLQDHLRRMFAYSGIAHSGYMLIGVLTACTIPLTTSTPTQSGTDALLFYLIAYGLMTVGAFAVFAYLAQRGNAVESVDDLAGLGKSHPFAAGMLALFFLSMIGLPLTAGFVGKFMLFMGAFEAPTTTTMKNMFRILAVIAAVNAAIAAVYYLRAIAAMYLRSPLKPTESKPTWTLSLLVAAVCALGTVAFGVYPQPVLNKVKEVAPPQTTPAAMMSKTMG